LYKLFPFPPLLLIFSIFRSGKKENEDKEGNWKGADHLTPTKEMGQTLKFNEINSTRIHVADSMIYISSPLHKTIHDYK
jgi:hypothetical protein